MQWNPTQRERAPFHFKFPPTGDTAPLQLMRNLTLLITGLTHCGRSVSGAPNLIIVWAKARPTDCPTTGRPRTLGEKIQQQPKSMCCPRTDRQLRKKKSLESLDDDFRSKHLVSSAYGFILKLQLGYDASEKYPCMSFIEFSLALKLNCCKVPNSLDFLSCIYPICDFPRVKINQSINETFLRQTVQIDHAVASVGSVKNSCKKKKKSF